MTSCMPPASSKKRSSDDARLRRQRRRARATPGPQVVAHAWSRPRPGRARTPSSSHVLASPRARRSRDGLLAQRRDLARTAPACAPGASPSQNGIVGGAPCGVLDPDRARLDPADAPRVGAEQEDVARPWSRSRSPRRRCRSTVASGSATTPVVADARGWRRPRSARPAGRRGGPAAGRSPVAVQVVGRAGRGRCAMPSASRSTTSSKSSRGQRRGTAPPAGPGASSSSSAHVARRPTRPRSAGPGCRAARSRHDDGVQPARRAPRSSAAHSTSSSRVSGNSRPFGVPVRRVAGAADPLQEGGDRCAASRSGTPARPAPTSMPSSSEAVATSARRSPARSRASTRCRRPRDRLPWCAATWAPTSSPSRSPSWWATRSAMLPGVDEHQRGPVAGHVARDHVQDLRRLLRRWGPRRARRRAARGPGPVAGGGRHRRSRTAASVRVVAVRPAPTSSRATASIGRWVADRPTRCSRLRRRRAPAARATAPGARRACSPATAWISSTITVRTLRSMARLRSGGQQQVQRLRRGDQDVRRRA